ncbi:ABC transporter substrate-binding protein [Silvanigrella aquatica]|uniref:Solute-binding protein family 5 domain-containing protein n=1 Tax=Silvanigrella aquatica TaxID=1915309 RepID=A0A1L4CZL6_9BACT|nr:ABC transporter substrate-binding protein [Silvanigrella aquatica]APJ03377.1 hypothetical protein AXG55_05430 [Silvanigrella aquatica]
MLNILKLIMLFLILLHKNINCSELEKSKNINIGFSYFLKEIDPILAYNHQHFMIIQFIYQTLVRINENGSLVGDLAESWKISEDKKTYFFYLNKNAQFHNGAIVNADDVVWSFSKHFWKNSGSTTVNYLQEILEYPDKIPDGALHPSISAVDKHTVQFKLKSPYPPFVSLLVMPSYTIFQKNNFNAKNPIGSGPYKAEYNSNNNNWIMRKNKKYIGKLPKTESFYLYELKNSKDIKNIEIEKNLDVVLDYFTEDMYAGIKRINNFDIKKISNLRNLHLYFNMNKGLFKNKKLRKELSVLVQKPFAAEGFYSHIYKFNPTYFPKGILSYEYYNGDNNLNEFDKGFIFKSQLPSKLHALVQKKYLDSNIIKKIETQFQSIGINIIWKECDSGYMEELAKNDYDILLAGYSSNFPDPDGLIDPLRNNSIFSYGNMPSEKLFQSLAEFRHIDNPKERLKSYSKVFKDFEQEYYFIPLFQSSLPILIKKNLFLPEAKFYYESELWKIHWKK